MTTMPMLAMLLQPPPEVIVDWNAVRQIAESFFFSIAAIAISLGLGMPLMRAWIRRSEGREILPAQEVAERLARIERSLDTIAIEVERVSESQRFLTRLSAERQSLPEHIADRNR